MCIACCRKIIISGIYHIGLCICGIIGFHDFFIHRYGNCLVFARFNGICLCKSDQFYGWFFNTVFLVIVGIWRLHVDFYDILACHIPSILYGHTDFVCIALILYGIIRPLEVGVGKSIAKWELYGRSVVIIACISASHHGIFVTCLIITITNIDTLRINSIFVAICHITVGDGKITNVFYGWRTLGIIGIGIC